MKIKMLPIIIILLLIITSFNFISLGSKDNNKIKILVEEENISFSETQIEIENDYLSVNIEEANSFTQEPGKAMIPVVSTTYIYPFKTKIISVECQPIDIIEQIISNKIQPAPQSYPISSLTHINNIEINDDKNKIYQNDDIYPNKWFDYKITCGRNGDSLATFLTVFEYPIQYLPSEDKIIRCDSMDITISYEEGQNPITFSQTYDMVIIAPRIFTFNLLPLVSHKNENGINTKLVTTESIYRDSLFGKFDGNGRDNAEKIKYFIKYALDEWNIKYVLLVGGRQGQLLKWHVPVRYSNLDDGLWIDDNWETSYLSDLYFADIYKEGGEFDDWDSNGNGIFAEWLIRDESTNETPKWVEYKDNLDLVPDVYLGRLACRTLGEVDTVVEKIKHYERKTYGSEWFNKMIIVGGDTIPRLDDDIYEGEYETNYASGFMKPLGFNIVELWVSTGNLTGETEVIDALNKGAGFFYLSGHGSPVVWSTHPPNENKIWIDALWTPSMNLLRNNEKLPICVVGGCHNSQFDASLLNFFKGLLEQKLSYFATPVSGNSGGFYTNDWWPVCWSWNLVRQENGGTIATIGNTGLGWGSGGESCIRNDDGWITTHFFINYAELSQQGKYNLGEVHSKTIKDFVFEFSNPSLGSLSQKTVQEWVLLGDPSLQIGGYP